VFFLGTIFRFGIYDEELSMSVPHLTVAQESAICLKLRAESPLHIQIQLDSKSHTVTLQRDSNAAIKIEKPYPKEVTFVVKIIGQGDFKGTIPLSWIPVRPYLLLFFFLDCLC
jgi:hypothetical protein